MYCVNSRYLLLQAGRHSAAFTSIVCIRIMLPLYVVWCVSLPNSKLPLKILQWGITKRGERERTREKRRERERERE